MSAKLLVDPANPADIAVKNRRKFASAGTDDIDVFTGGARDREDFLDTAIRVLAAVVFFVVSAVQAARRRAACSRRLARRRHHVYRCVL